MRKHTTQFKSGQTISTGIFTWSFETGKSSLDEVRTVVPLSGYHWRRAGQRGPGYQKNSLSVMNMSHKAVCLKALHLTVCKLYLHKNEGNNNKGKRPKQVHCHSHKINYCQARKMNELQFYTIKWWENSLMVQWLGLLTLTAPGLGSILGWGTKIPQAPPMAKKLKKLS